MRLTLRPDRQGKLRAAELKDMADGSGNLNQDPDERRT
jgi:hypothetical protein